jgi:hypothetical protein
VLLILIPVSWVGPVIAPVLVSIAMIVAGIWCLRQETAGKRLPIGPWNTTGVVLGACVIVLSFTLDYRNILAGGRPRPFHWIVFSLGLAIGVASYGNREALYFPGNCTAASVGPAVVPRGSRLGPDWMNTLFASVLASNTRPRKPDCISSQF